MTTLDYFDRVISSILERIAQHDEATDPIELEYVSGLYDALSIVEAEADRLR